MLRGFLGKKIGMSQVFRDNGELVPVTVIQAGPCAVTQIKNQETDGYDAIQLGFGSTISVVVMTMCICVCIRMHFKIEFTRGIGFER